MGVQSVQTSFVKYETEIEKCLYFSSGWTDVFEK